MKDAITERSPAYAILAIDSEDRFRDFDEAAVSSTGAFNYSPYDFQITKSESMMNGFFTRLALTEMCFPWTIPNILNATAEIAVEYQVGASPVGNFLISLGEGFLRPSQIAAQIQAAIRAFDAPNLGAATFIYGGTAAAPYPYFTYATNTAGVTINFLPLAYDTTAFPFPPTTKQLFNLLGFDSQNTVLASTGEGLATYCQSIRYIDIVCSQLTYNQALKDTMSQRIARDTLCRLYLGDGPYTATSTLSPNDANFCPPGCAPFTIYRQFSTPKFIRWMPNQPVQGNLRFQVFDDNGESLANADYVEGAGSNWSMTLLVSED
jgi:hypothetical protein